MPPPPGEHSRTRSNAEIDPTEYRILYELERRLNEKFSEARAQAKEDIASAIAPLYPRLEAIEERLSEGSQHFQEHENRLGDHSDHIRDVNKLIETHLRDSSGTRTALRAAEVTKEEKPTLMSKLLVNLGLPLVIAILSPLLSIWVMIQLKLVAFADPTPVPGIHAQTKP